MAVCPHCGDEGAPPRGHCLLCGQDVSLPASEATQGKLAGYDGSGDLPTGVVDLSDTHAPLLDPLEDTGALLEPLPEMAPLVFEPLEFDDPEPPLPRLQPKGPAAPRVMQPVAPRVMQPVAPPVMQPVSPPVIQPVSPPVVQPVLQPVQQPVEPPPKTRARAAAKAASHLVESAPVPVEPHAALVLRARYEFTSVPADDPPVIAMLLEIEATGRPLVGSAAGPVAHVILALDLSASMKHKDKYPVLKDAIASMLDDLHAEDAAEVLLSAVIFSKGAETLFREVPARRVSKQAFFKAIETNRLCFGRYTDIGGALSRAGRIAYDQTRANPKLPVRIYLLTDGKPQDMPRARQVAGRLHAVAADIHGLAFGADSDVAALQELFAGQRGGTVKSVRRETIGNAFERVAEVAQRVLATRCPVRIDLDPGVVGGDVFRYRPARVRFPAPAFPDGKRFAADLGTIEKGRTYSLLFEVRPPETKERFTRLGLVSVQIPGAEGAITETLELSVARTSEGSEPGDIDDGVRTARDILGALSADDPQTALRALRLRRQLYEQEKRDPGVLAILDKAIDLLEKEGSLDSLSPGDHATLLAHTCTSGTEY